MRRPGSRQQVDAWWWGVPVIALCLAVLLWGSNLNVPLFLLLNGDRGPTWDLFWAHATLFGDALVVLVLLLPFVGRRPDILWSAVIAAVLVTLWSHGLKEWLQLPRPAAVIDAASMHVVGPVHRQGAFPSGHTGSAFTLVGVILLNTRSNRWALPLLLAALLVGLSRIMVGAHWPLDLLGGAFGGWLAAAAATVLARRLTWGTGAAAQWVIGILLAAAALWLLSGFDTGYDTLPAQRLIALVCLAAGITGAMRIRGG